MRPEYFHALSCKWQGYPESEAAELFSRFVGMYAANSLPPWYYYIAMHGVAADPYHQGTASASAKITV